MATPSRGQTNASRWFIGVMTGTSLDAIDVAIIELDESVTLGHVQPSVAMRHFYSRPLDHAMVDALIGLQAPSDNELHRAALIANAYADTVSRTVLEALTVHGLPPHRITAIGVHGQTIRHQPQLGYSIQLNAPARIAETTGITVVSDFRSRDLAAGGQGAPLVPAFHRAIFANTDPNADARSPHSSETAVTAIVNIGGIANITWLGAPMFGYDTGPGNALMDLWIRRHHGDAFDRDGAWAATGTPHNALLSAMLGDPFFGFLPPRSTGRDLFSESWLQEFLSQSAFSQISAKDVQATLAALTAVSIAQEIRRLETMPRHSGSAARCAEVLICGGGARNTALLNLLRSELKKRCGRAIDVQSTAVRGWDPQTVEAAAFAWLAARSMDGQPGNDPQATGAAGPRVLGSITPA
ncbi:MAG: anhydro-N-acetylmuramic acid kinase [Burkholderiaceae bacterium]